jgi:hypothetical protein
MVFTFAGAPDPTAILPGWNGSPTAVTLKINENGANDFVTILSQAGAQLTALGSVSLGGDYADRQHVTASGSTMTLSGNVVTVVLGPSTGKSFTQTKPGTMVWTTPTGTATESGPLDNEF